MAILRSSVFLFVVAVTSIQAVAADTDLNTATFTRNVSPRFGRQLGYLPAVGATGFSQSSSSAQSSAGSTAIAPPVLGYNPYYMGGYIPPMGGFGAAGAQAQAQSQASAMGSGIGYRGY